MTPGARIQSPADACTREISIAEVGEYGCNLYLLSRPEIESWQFAKQKVRALQSREFLAIDLLTSPHVEQTIGFPMYVRHARDYVTVQ
jgi:hypothetical protein